MLCVFFIVFKGFSPLCYCHTGTIRDKSVWIDKQWAAIFCDYKNYATKLNSHHQHTHIHYIRKKYVQIVGGKCISEKRNLKSCGSRHLLLPSSVNHLFIYVHDTLFSAYSCIQRIDSLHFSLLYWFSVQPFSTYADHLILNEIAKACFFLFSFISRFRQCTYATSLHGRSLN